jgi:hypothetical protein
MWRSAEGASVDALAAAVGAVDGSFELPLPFGFAAAVLEVSDVNDNEENDGEQQNDSAANDKGGVIAKFQKERHANHGFPTDRPARAGLIVTSGQ